MKNFCKKLSDIIRVIFGYGILICLFVGGMTFFGYLAALIIGGDTATTICTFIYKTILPYVIYISGIMVVLGLVAMYLAGEKALTSEKKESAKHEGEM